MEQWQLVAIGAVAGTFIPSATQLILLWRRHQHVDAVRLADLRKTTYVEYVAFLLKVPTFMERSIRRPDHEQHDLLRDLKDGKADLDAALRVHGSDAVKRFLDKEIPEAIENFVRRQGELSSADMARPRQERAGVDATTSQAFREELLPVVTRLADEMGSEVA